MELELMPAFFLGGREKEYYLRPPDKNGSKNHRISVFSVPRETLIVAVILRTGNNSTFLRPGFFVFLGVGLALIINDTTAFRK